MVIMDCCLTAITSERVERPYTNLATKKIKLL